MQATNSFAYPATLTPGDYLLLSSVPSGKRPQSLSLRIGDDQVYRSPLDGIELVAVPEPSTLWMVFGLAGIMAARFPAEEKFECLPDSGAQICCRTTGPIAMADTFTARVFCRRRQHRHRPDHPGPIPDPGADQNPTNTRNWEATR